MMRENLLSASLSAKEPHENEQEMGCISALVFSSWFLVPLCATFCIQLIVLNVIIMIWKLYLWPLEWCLKKNRFSSHLFWLAICHLINVTLHFTITNRNIYLISQQKLWKKKLFHWHKRPTIPCKRIQFHLTSRNIKLRKIF